MTSKNHPQAADMKHGDTTTAQSSTAFRLTIAGIMLLAVLVRIAVAVDWQQTAVSAGSVFRVGDSHSYWTLAEHIARGEAYQYGSENASIFRAPLYPLLLAPFTMVDNQAAGVFAARCLGCILGGLAVGLLCWLTTRLAGPRAGILAALMGCFYPSAVGMSVTILSEAVFMPLMLGQLLCWYAADRSDTRPALWALAAGGLAGLAILARPSWLLFLPFAIVVSSLFHHDRKRNLLCLSLACLGVACVMSPWWIRNAWITGKFVPTTLQVGPSLYDGLHAGASGASDEGMDFMRDILTRQLEHDALHPDQLESTLEWRVNQRAMREATEWAGSHPGQVIALAVQKFLRTWSLWPGGGEMSSGVIRLAITASCFTVTLLALGFTLLQAIRLKGIRRSWVGILWLPCLYFTALHMVFVGSVRYREPAIFVLIVLAACALDAFYGRVIQRPKPST